MKKEARRHVTRKSLNELTAEYNKARKALDEAEGAISDVKSR